MISDCSEKGLGYVILGMWVGTTAQWTIATQLLRPLPDSPKSPPQDIELSVRTNNTSDISDLLGPNPLPSDTIHSDCDTQ